MSSWIDIFTEMNFTDSMECINIIIIITGMCAGVLVNVHPYALGRLRSIWGVDAELFKPSRWLGEKRPTSFEVLALVFHFLGCGGRLVQYFG